VRLFGPHGWYARRCFSIEIELNFSSFQCVAVYIGCRKVFTPTLAANSCSHEVRLQSSDSVWTVMLTSNFWEITAKRAALFGLFHDVRLKHGPRAEVLDLS
jgi:hypothetical protein